MPISNHPDLVEMIKFLVTGTAAYGPQTENSDLDIVVSAEEGKKIESFLTSHNINAYRTERQEEYKKKTGASGFYFALGCIKVNMILTPNMEPWEKGTAHMKKLKPISNREERIAEFNSIADWTFGEDHDV